MSKNYKQLPDDVTGVFNVYVYNVLHRQEEKKKTKLIWQMSITNPGPYFNCQLAKYSNYGTEKGWNCLKGELAILDFDVAKVDDLDEVVDKLIGLELEIEIGSNEDDKGNSYRTVQIIRKIEPAKDTDTPEIQFSDKVIIALEEIRDAIRLLADKKVA